MKAYLKLSVLVLAAAAILSVPAGLPGADTVSHLTIRNNTTRTLHGVLWQGNDSAHVNHNGPEWQYGVLNPKSSAKADVPSCKFSFVLWDDKDLWHFEIHDCNSATMTVNSDKDDYHVTLK
jgi:hypothetical protein